VVAEFYRSRKEQSSIEVLSEEEMKDKKNSAESITDKAEAALIKTALNKLDDEYRQVITLRHFEGCSIRQIAHNMGRTENSTRVLLHRAIKHLRKIIENEG
jgi:RNA polymerase sigma-70 factor (ECF subfamily)